jgi:hypothetical protein
MKTVYGVRSALADGEPLRPPESVRNLREVAVWFLYFTNADIGQYLSPAAYMYYRRLLRHTGLDISIPYEKCITPIITVPKPNQQHQQSNNTSTSTSNSRPRRGM